MTNIIIHNKPSNSTDPYSNNDSRDAIETECKTEKEGYIVCAMCGEYGPVSYHFNTCQSCYDAIKFSYL